MENEKKFSNEMFGYDKREVEEYIKAMKAEYESKIQAEKSDANRIANELTILKRKLERKIKDKKALDVVFKVIDSDSEGLSIR